MGQLKIDHMRDTINVDSTGRNICGNQYRRIRRLERGQCPLTMILALVAVNRCGTNTRFFKIPLQLVGPVFGACENNHAAHALVLQKVHEQVTLLLLWQKED